MALVPTVLAGQLTQFFSKMRNATEVDDMAMANELATIITDYIKTAQVSPGIPVSTTGTPVAQTGATTGPGTII